MFNYDWAYRAAVPIKTFNQGYERGSPVYATFSFLRLLEKLNICAQPQAESAWSYFDREFRTYVFIDDDDD